ncbi:MAG: hypothetical protein ABI588_02815 [Arenimonas sp.]
MKPLALTLVLVSGLLAGAAVSPPAAPAPDYTTQMSEPPLLPEYEPSTTPPPYAAAPGEAGGIRQCIGADGVPIFTDRRCEDLQATPYQPPPSASGSFLPPGQLRVRTCACNQDDLLAGVRAALENHDANRLADYYHWTGMGSTEGYRLMERLDSFSARPVVDVQLVRSANPEGDPAFDPYAQARTPTPEPPFFDEEGLPLAPGGNAAAAPAPEPATPRRKPHALLLRVDQMRSDHDAASTTTYFHLLTNAGCWWMRF